MRSSYARVTASTLQASGTPFRTRSLELDSRACDEVLHSRADEHRAGSREDGDAGADVNRDAAHVVIGELNLAGMQPDAPAVSASRPRNRASSVRITRG